MREFKIADGRVHSRGFDLQMREFKLTDGRVQSLDVRVQAGGELHM